MTRIITLGNGRKVTLSNYVKSWKVLLIINPNTFIPICPNGWPGYAHEALAQLRYGMNDRINKHIPWYNKGRKWSNLWQNETLRAARDLNTPRLAIHWLPPHLKTRFSDRLSTNDYF